jgi:hypothetical protein
LSPQCEWPDTTVQPDGSGHLRRSSELSCREHSLRVAEASAIVLPTPTPPETVGRGNKPSWRFSTLRLMARSKSASWGYSILSDRIGQEKVATPLKSRSSLLPVQTGPKSRRHYFCSIRGFSRLSRSTLSFSTSEVGSTGFSSGFEAGADPGWSFSDEADPGPQAMELASKASRAHRMKCFMY